MAEHIVELRKASKVFGKGNVKVVALDETDLVLNLGHFVVILGPSGCGKTTLLNLIGALDRPTTGEVFLDGQSLGDLSDEELTIVRREKIGFIFQSFNLIPTLTAMENVQLAAELVDKPLDSNEVLEQVGLSERANHFPSELSGGEQQRVAIARGIVKQPKILLGDEPTGELDFETGRKILVALRKLTDDQKQLVVIVTHNTAIAACADRVIKLRSGKIVSDELNENPLDPADMEW